ncbi:MAG: aspartate ammonia-lyase, partial [Chloroflexi bacterium]|nr:aspartate ammonia-lyase [Chloroflexota bacterium]
VCQVAAHVIGNDAAIAVGGQSGNFEINVMMPVCAYNLLQSIDLLAAAARNLDEQCIRGLTATSAGPDMVERGLAIVTTLVPHIGYDASASIAKEAQATGKTVKEVAIEMTDLSSVELDDILDPSGMTEPGLSAGGVSVG